MTPGMPRVDRERLLAALREESDVDVEAGAAFADARQEARERAAAEAARAAETPAADVRAGLGPDRAALVDHITLLGRGGLTRAAAARQLALLRPGPEVAAALNAYRGVVAQLPKLPTPAGAVGPDLQPWYPGPTPHDTFWPTYRAVLERKGWPAVEVAKVDAASTKTVALLAPPSSDFITTRGLVLGHIQSGKTAQLTAVIAKAADAGYRMFVVLSGLHTALRNQTQRRLDRELVASHPDRWFQLTDVEHDFRPTGNADFLLGGRMDGRLLAVVKKHDAVLGHLSDWLANARPEVLRACPVLVVDDEADQASINLGWDDGERSTINGHIVGLLRALPKAAYVGYTATPFANLLIDPPTEELYPKDFILDLPRPEGYFGPERVFGRDVVPWDERDQPVVGLDVIRVVPDHEVPALQPRRQDRAGFRASITPSLERAVRQFLLATAARAVRGQAGQHASMLVHTSVHPEVHASTRDALTEYTAAVRRRLDRGDETLHAELGRQWEEERDRIPAATFGLRPVVYEEIRGELARVVRRVEVKVENGISDDRIDYNAGGPKTYIVVGGNVLSRGLTLEGLTVSFFLRSASAYDTLLQMGRWFGFRPGYEDLPRVWMTEELRGFFFDLGTVEREIRVDLERFEDGRVPPGEFGPRIREHPKLAITAKAKMRRAVRAQMSFTGRTLQTTLFKHRDRGWLADNLDAGRRLVRACADAVGDPETLRDRPHRLFFDVAAEHVLRFLSEYRIHEDQIDTPADLIRDYIREQIRLGDLRFWNVAIVGRDVDERLGAVDFGLTDEVPLLNRARFLRGDLQHASIKALISEIDEAVDLDVPTTALRGRSRAQLRELRQAEYSDQGLLLLYPISKDSVPPAGNRNEFRRPLRAEEHVLGIALVFPTARMNTPRNYMTVRVPPELRTELEEDRAELAAAESSSGGDLLAVEESPAARDVPGRAAGPGGGGPEPSQ